MRAFVALSLPDDVLTALTAVQARLPPGRLVPEENLHLTLAFMAELDEHLEEPVFDALSGLRTGPVEISFGGLMGLGARTVAMEVEPAPSLLSLHAQVQSRLKRAGVALPREKFRPHVTLLRLRREPNGSAAAVLARALATGFQIPSFEAHALSLFQSTLGPDRARHDQLAEFWFTR